MLNPALARTESDQSGFPVAGKYVGTTLFFGTNFSPAKIDTVSKSGVAVNFFGVVSVGALESVKLVLVTGATGGVA